MTFREPSTKGWLMDTNRPTSMDAYLRAERRKELAQDPDPAILSQLIERGKAEVQR